MKNANMAWALKYRPKVFSDLVGQEMTARVLRNALDEGKIHSGYLFTGLYGTGKTTVTRIFAKAINCLDRKGADPCNACESCETIESEQSLDYTELDGATSGSIDAIRKIKDSTQYLPVLGKKKIFAIDECHAISGAASQALLKTLEETPPHVVFMFATTEAHKIPDTVRSRCLSFGLNRLSASDISSRIKYIFKNEKVTFEDAAADAIAQAADGSLRDAVMMSEQLYLYTKNNITLAAANEVLGVVDNSYYFDMIDAILAQDPVKVINTLEEVSKRGVQPNIVLKSLLGALDTIIRFKSILPRNADQRLLKYKDVSMDRILTLFNSFTWAKDKVILTWKSEYNALELSLVAMTRGWLNTDISKPPVLTNGVVSDSKPVATGDVKAFFSGK